MKHWIGQLEDGSMGLRRADPGSEDFDEFQCGDTEYAIEVRDYFRDRKWFKADKKKASPATYEVSTVDEVVGYLAAGHANRPHPTHDSETKARYLVIYVAGLRLRHQGVENPHSPTLERYSDGLFRLAEEVLAPEGDDCVGLYLRVRANNAQAIRFYERFGFEVDPTGPDDGNIYMRKVF